MREDWPYCYNLCYHLQTMALTFFFSMFSFTFNDLSTSLCSLFCELSSVLTKKTQLFVRLSFTFSLKYKKKVLYLNLNIHNVLIVNVEDDFNWLAEQGWGQCFLLEGPATVHLIILSYCIAGIKYWHKVSSTVDFTFCEFLANWSTKLTKIQQYSRLWLYWAVPMCECCGTVWVSGRALLRKSIHAQRTYPG